MADPKPLKITVLDEETGEEGHAEIYPGDYFLACAEPCHLAHTQTSKGTHQLTIKGYAPRKRSTLDPSGEVPDVG